MLLHTSPLLPLLLMHALAPSSAADLCTFEGTDNRGNFVAANSLCDGSWVGDSTSCPYYDPDCQTRLHLGGSGSWSGGTWAGGLTGTIPTEIGLLTQLTMLHLAANSTESNGAKLSGVVPSQLGMLTNLDALYLSYNALSGVLPTELSQLGPFDTGSVEYGSCDIGGRTNHFVCPLPALDATCLAGSIADPLSCTYKPPPPSPPSPPSPPPSPPPPSLPPPPSPPAPSAPSLPPMYSSARVVSVASTSSNTCTPTWF